MSLLCSGVLETPCLAVRVMIYSHGEYIPVIKCIGYKQNHGADPDLWPPHSQSYGMRLAWLSRNTIVTTSHVVPSGWLHLARLARYSDSSLRTSGSQPASPSRSNELTVVSYL